MATFNSIFNANIESTDLQNISTEKLISGLKILKKTHKIFIPVGLDNRLERVVSVKHNKKHITIKTHSSDLIIRVLDLKHLVHLFVIE